MWKRQIALAQVGVARQRGEVLGDGAVAHLVLRRGHGPLAFLGRHAPRIHEAAHVVPLPVLQQERRRRDAGVAEHGTTIEVGKPRVRVRPQAAGLAVDEDLLLAARIVVARDGEDAGIVVAQGGSQLGERGEDDIFQEIAAAALAYPGMVPDHGQQVAAEKHGPRPFGEDALPEAVVPAPAAVEVAGE